jgi:hypothetical protein
VARTKISSTDLLWVLRERLSSVDDRLKVAPLAIVPGDGTWKVVTSPRYRNSVPQFAKRVQQIQEELQKIYTLARD